MVTRLDFENAKKELWNLINEHSPKYEPPNGEWYPFWEEIKSVYHEEKQWRVWYTASNKYHTAAGWDQVIIRSGWIVVFNLYSVSYSDNHGWEILLGDQRLCSWDELEEFVNLRPDRLLGQRLN